MDSGACLYLYKLAWYENGSIRRSFHMDWNHDLHVHTNLSACARPSATLEGYLGACVSSGIGILGISNHVWDSDVAGASPWYVPQNIDHVLRIRQEIASLSDCSSVRVLIGCETEFLGGKHLAMKKENAKLFDYVLIPHGHFHMAGLVRPHEVQSTDALRELLIERFVESVQFDLGVRTGIAHPFHTHGFDDVEEEILAGISDQTYRDCMAMAAMRQISIEINSCQLASSVTRTGQWMRMLYFARDEGCTFHLGSDAHSINGLACHEQLVALAKECGIAEKDLTNFA